MICEAAAFCPASVPDGYGDHMNNVDSDGGNDDDWHRSGRCLTPYIVVLAVVVTGRSGCLSSKIWAGRWSNRSVVDRGR